MISQLSQLNLVSLSLAFIAYSILGALWFTKVFNKTYKISLGKENDVLPNGLIFMVGPMICTFVITLATSVLFYALNISSIGQAMELAFVIGIGFLVANTINIAINPNIPRPIHYGIISGGYHLVGIILVNLILVLLK